MQCDEIHCEMGARVLYTGECVPTTSLVSVAGICGCPWLKSADQALDLAETRGKDQNRRPLCLLLMAGTCVVRVHVGVHKVMDVDCEDELSHRLHAGWCALRIRSIARLCRYAAMEMWKCNVLLRRSRLALDCTIPAILLGARLYRPAILLVRASEWLVHSDPKPTCIMSSLTLGRDESNENCAPPTS